MSMSHDTPKTPFRTQVAIVGAGIGGLSAALFLRARGFQVHLFESKSWEQVQTLTVRGNGIHLYFHCARMLANAGLPLAKYLTPLDIQMRRDDGKLRTDITRPVQLKVCPQLNVIRASVYSLLRQHLYKALVENTPRETLHCDKRCVAVTERNRRVEVDFADGTVISADLVVGADGIHSIIADQLFGPRNLDKHDIAIVQGLSTFNGLDPVETWLLRRGGGTMGLVPVVLPSMQPGTFWWLTVPISQLGDPEGADLALYHKHCETFSWKYVDLVAAETDPTSLERWYSKDKAPLKTWSRGRVVMLGDACHAANPFSGYGAGMSIEDAYWLGRFLRDPSILDRPDDYRNAIDDYQRKRVGLTTKIVKDARGLMRMLHPSNKMLSSSLELMWHSRIPGPFIARKFISVFEQGLRDTEWQNDEMEQGKLAL